MSKAFISILGTNDYLESYHYFNDKKLSDTPGKYVQEDLLKYFCEEWKANDEVRIFLTEDARNKNWLDNGHIDRITGKQKENIGLYNRLVKMNYCFSINDFSIPDGNSENELWDIFEIIFNSFKDDDEVIIDITHSFRFLPLLLTVILNYTRQIKNIKIKGVYYAAFETLGQIQEVSKWPVEKRIVPIFDLTPLVKLQEWTLATYDFTFNANTNLLQKLVQNEIRTIIADKKFLKESEKVLKKTIDNMEKVSNNIALCRGKEIIDFDYEDLLKKLTELKNYNSILIKPVKQLIDVIINKINQFVDNDINNGFRAVDWAIKHKLYQQAITLLQEVIITKVLKDAELDIDELKNREIVTSAIKIKNSNITQKDWKGKASKYPKITNKILSLPLLEKIKDDYDKLTALRNDVNHAGFLNKPKAKSYKSIIAQLNNIYRSILSKVIVI